MVREERGIKKGEREGGGRKREGGRGRERKGGRRSVSETM